MTPLLFTWSDLSLVPSWFWATFITFLGLCVGSFLNVVIYRVPREESVAWPGSHCPSCGNAIAWYDNIPVLSYLVLLGKCRACRSRISPIYPAVEFLTGLLFFGVFYRFVVQTNLIGQLATIEPALPGQTTLGMRLILELVATLVFVAALVALIFIDYFEQILPDAITKPGLILALLLRAVSYNFAGTATLDLVLQNWFGKPLPNGMWGSLINAVIGMLIGGGSLWLIGVGYFRLRSFRIETVEDFGAFLRDCVTGSNVRLRVRRGGRVTSVYIEGGDFAALSPEERAEIGFAIAEGGSPELAPTALTGVTVETNLADGKPTGITLRGIPEGSPADQYGLKANDVVTHANMEGMGLGDVKMMFFVGAFLGCELTFLTLLVASLLGGFVALYKLVTAGREAMRTAVPFGVMLGIGALFALFFGEAAIDAYFNLFINLPPGE